MCEVGAVKQGYQYQISCLLMVVVGVQKCGASSTMPIMVMVHGWWLVGGSLVGGGGWWVVGKKFEIENDSSIWREEIGNRHIKNAEKKTSLAPALQTAELEAQDSQSVGSFT